MTRDNNPLLTSWTTPFEMPPFEAISDTHFAEAFDCALAAHRKEIAAIAKASEPATFDNTIVALERSGRQLRRVAGVFFNLAVADTNDARKAIERDYAPRLAAHSNEIYANEALFGRIADLFERTDELEVTVEQARVLERYHTRFVRGGARLDGAAKKRLAEIVERLSELCTRFSQNVLADEASYELVLEGDDALAGLPDFLIEAAAQSAADLGLEGKHAITLARSSIEPFLQFSERRDLREEAFKAWTRRGADGGETDNRELISEIVALRQERAKLLGFEKFADYKLDDAMAKRPEAVRDLLMEVWAPALERAEQERDRLQAMVQAEGGNFDLAAWDWRHYAEKVRKAEHNLDEGEIKPYFQLDGIIEAAFHTANRLFGLSFRTLDDMPVHHPDVRVWEVLNADGGHVGIFCGDYFARPSKRSGAWSSSFRSQERVDDDIRPLVVNVMNFVKGRAGGPALLSFDDARTLFHEFGHALHALLSDVTYPYISGTSVAGDFVELPSQLYEHWLEQPEILRKFAAHAESGEPIPEDLLDRLLEARNYGSGFSTVEYVASAFVDMELHKADPEEARDIDAFEAGALDRLGMPDEIIMRHRLPHFLHVFAGDGYAAGYYSYLWSEVMDADAFCAFQETGDIFDRETANRLYQFIYSAGGRCDPAEAYQAFRGRMPSVDALLVGRGLKEPDDTSA